MASSPFKPGGNVNIGTPGKQEFPSDETPPGYTYRPPQETYTNIPISEMPYGLEEFKSRLDAAGTFFRSLDVGPQTNDIWITVTRNGNDYTLTVSNDTITETYTAEQIEDSTGFNPSAIPELRLLVNENSQLIDMPERGFDIVDNLGTDPRTGRTVNRGPFSSVYPFGEQGIEEIEKTFLFGGKGVPSNPTQFDDLPRTGPQRTMAHINWSERNTADGTMEVFNVIIQWSGASITEGEWVQAGLQPNKDFSA
jgi:hypothetical protein